MCGLHIVRSDLYHDGKPFFRTQRKPRFPRGREGTVLNERPHVDYFDGLRIFAALCYLATGKTYAEACRSCNWVYTFRRLRGHSAAEK